MTAVSNLSLAQATGTLFCHDGKVWLRAPEKGIPNTLSDLEDGYRLLVADGGILGEKSGRPARVWNWDLPVETSRRKIVGYWYGSEESAIPETFQTRGVAKPETFEHLGRIFTCCDGKAVPAGLAREKGGDWAYVTKVQVERGQHETYAAKHASWGPYWGPSVHIVGYRILTAQEKAEEKEPEFIQPPAVKRVILRPSAYGEGQALHPHLKQEDVTSKEIVDACAMIDRDGKPETAEEKHNRLVEQMVGNGNIFAPMKRTVHPLFRVTPITVTGHVLWGTEHKYD